MVIFYETGGVFSPYWLYIKSNCKVQENSRGQRKVKTEHNLCITGQPFFKVLFEFILHSMLKQVKFLLESENGNHPLWLVSLKMSLFLVVQIDQQAAEEDDYAHETVCM